MGLFEDFFAVDDVEAGGGGVVDAASLEVIDRGIGVFSLDGVDAVFGKFIDGELEVAWEVGGYVIGDSGGLGVLIGFIVKVGDGGDVGVIERTAAEAQVEAGRGAEGEHSVLE